MTGIMLKKAILESIEDELVTIVIRKCTLADLSELQQISRETFADTFGPENSPANVNQYLDESYNLDRLKQELTDADSDFFFALVDGQVAGYLKVNVGNAQTEAMGNHALEVQRIYIKPAFKRQGIGSKLMAQALAVAKDNHRSTVWLGVWEHNLLAQQLYQKFGFKQTGDHVFTLGESRQRDLIMSRTIEGESQHS